MSKEGEGSSSQKRRTFTTDRALWDNAVDHAKCSQQKHHTQYSVTCTPGGAVRHIPHVKSWKSTAWQTVITILIYLFSIAVTNYYLRQMGIDRPVANMGSSIDLELSVVNMELTDELTDNTTEAYHNFSTTFCTAMNELLLLSIDPADGTTSCVVKALRAGSVKVDFSIFAKGFLKSSNSFAAALRKALQRRQPHIKDKFGYKMNPNSIRERKPSTRTPKTSKNKPLPIRGKPVSTLFTIPQNCTCTSVLNNIKVLENIACAVDGDMSSADTRLKTMMALKPPKLVPPPPQFKRGRYRNAQEKNRIKKKMEEAIMKMKFM